MDIPVIMTISPVEFYVSKGRLGLGISASREMSALLKRLCDRPILRRTGRT